MEGEAFFFLSGGERVAWIPLHHLKGDRKSPALSIGYILFCNILLIVITIIFLLCIIYLSKNNLSLNST